MAVKLINPYLLFEGTAEKARVLYQRALDAKDLGVMRWADMPGGAGKVPPENAQLIMHAALQAPGGATLMLADVPPPEKVGRSGQLQVHVELESAQELQRCFDILADGGKVKMAPHDAFWEAHFAQLTDAFGVNWMLTAPPLKKK